MFESLMDVTPAAPDSTDRPARYRAEDQEGHATHFLARLKRADGGQAELAMDLYHKPKLLRMVLAMMDPAKEHERVAISLDPEDKGPYIVATREGRFVTCLGEGMKIGDLYLIGHDRLRSYLDRLEELHGRREFIEEATSDLKKGYGLNDLVYTKGLGMSREDFLAVSVLQPALKYEYLIAIFDIIDGVKKAEASLLRFKKLPTKMNRALRSYWNGHWSLGHMSMLITMFGPQGIEKFVDSATSDFFPFYSPFHTGQFGLAARALYAVSRLGRFSIPACKLHMKEARSPLHWLFGLLGLTAIGLRHDKLKSRARKTVHKALTNPTDKPSILVRWYISKLGEDFLPAVLGSFDDPDTVHEYVSERQKKTFYKRFGGRLPAPYDFSSPEEVPDDLAFAYSFNTVADFRNEPKFTTALAMSIPWLTRADPQDLYLPRDILERHNVAWKPAFTEYLVDNVRKWIGKRQPKKGAERPGRNDPCPCGSGKKFKKCCMRKQDAKTKVDRVRVARDEGMEWMLSPEEISAAEIAEAEIASLEVEPANEEE